MRILIGLLACGVYVWRVLDPKAAYAVLYDLTDWTTAAIAALFVGDDAVTSFVRSALNLVLVDQAEGFLIGVALTALASVVFWPVRAGGRAAVSAIRRLRHHPTDREPPPRGGSSGSEDRAESPGNGGNGQPV